VVTAAWCSALQRKMLRESWLLKGQVATIALVIASGIMSFIMLRGTYQCLESARERYYDRYRFAHVFAHVERAPEAVARAIEALPGVAQVQTRVAEEVTLPLEGMPRPAYGRLLSLPASVAPATNALHLESGRLPERSRDDEVVLLDAFARAHGLLPGHHLSAVINGRLERLLIVGTAQSPEFVYAIRPGAIVDDPKRYAVLWMERATAAAAFQLEGAFNEISLRLEPGASEAVVMAAVDRLLRPYGGNGAIARRDQISNKMLTGELGTLEGLAAMIPLVFLGVSIFLIRLVLGRLITLQRTEIAALKAVGYTNREVAAHYLGLCAVVLVPGCALGVVGGDGLGRVVLGIYANVFRFPDLEFQLSLSLVLAAVGLSVLGAVSGALLAVRGAVRLPPAEAMRPAAPARYRHGLFEHLGLPPVLGPIGMMIAREIYRRPLKTVMSAVGIAGAISLLILGRFGWDSMTSYFDGTFFREQRQDLTVTFDRPLPVRAITELARQPGVFKAEALRAIPARVRREHRMRDIAIIGLPRAATLRRLIERGGREVSLPADGALVTTKLAEILELDVGDRVTLEVKEGERATVEPVIAGFVDEAVGLSVYLDSEALAALIGDQGAVSTALLEVDPREVASIEDFLRRSPVVIDVSDLHADMLRLYDMNKKAFDVWTLVSTLLAVAVIFGVVYNNARIALAAQSRDLASLRVLGFSRREISRILLGSLAVEVLLAIPIGLLLGLAWAHQFASAMDQETFRWQVVIAPHTYAFAAGVALLAAAASALWVRQSLDRLDLIGVLKTRE
jgi:putative ABC transport system permease protein